MCGVKMSINWTYLIGSGGEWEPELARGARAGPGFGRIAKGVGLVCGVRSGGVSGARGAREPCGLVALR